eukprot:2348462-Alexandrium_andersonii.AAC.1
MNAVGAPCLWPLALARPERIEDSGWDGGGGGAAEGSSPWRPLLESASSAKADDAEGSAFAPAPAP